MLDAALQDTAALWAPLARAYGWIHQAAHVLANAEELTGAQVQRRLTGLLGAMTRWGHLAGELKPAVAHFLKVSRSYWPGLFHCYDIEGLPRTNNDLEQLFGSHRYHERRATGRKQGSPALVVRGAARLIASVATRQRRYTADDLAGCNHADWRALRATLDQRSQSRVWQRRFRQDSQAYLSDLEQQLLKLILPP